MDMFEEKTNDKGLTFVMLYFARNKSLQYIYFLMFGLFKMRGRQGGGGSGSDGGGGDRDSKLQLSIEPCTKCHFIGGSRGTGLLTGGLKPPALPPLWLRPCEG